MLTISSILSHTLGQGKVLTSHAIPANTRPLPAPTVTPAEEERVLRKNHRGPQALSERPVVAGGVDMRMPCVSIIKML